MADKSFGVKELRITGTGTPTIESPGGGNLNLNAATSTFSGNVSVTGAELSVGKFKIKEFSNNPILHTNTSDGSDNLYLGLNGGGATSHSRGSGVFFIGNEYTSIGGTLQLYAGDVSTGDILLQTQGTTRVKIDYDGSVEFSGDINANGNVTLGDDASNDTLSINALIDTHLIPKAIFSSDLYNLGSSTLRWNDIYATGTIYADAIRLDDATGKLQIGSAPDLELYHNNTNGYIDNNKGNLYIRNNVNDDDNGDIHIQAKSGEEGIVVYDDGVVALYTNGDLRFVSGTSGSIGNISYANMSPSADNTWDLGMNALRWRDVYVVGQVKTPKGNLHVGVSSAAGSSSFNSSNDDLNPHSSVGIGLTVGQKLTFGYSGSNQFSTWKTDGNHGRDYGTYKIRTDRGYASNAVYGNGAGGAFVMSNNDGSVLLVSNFGQFDVGNTAPVSGNEYNGYLFQMDGTVKSCISSTAKELASDTAGTAPSFIMQRRTNGKAFSFRDGDAPSDEVGSISFNISGSTSFNETSDYRIKENVVGITSALDKINQLRPVNFNFIGKNMKLDGFIAHEVQAVIPYAVTGEKDAVKTVKDGDHSNDGTKEAADRIATLPSKEVPDLQQLDKSKLIALLTASVQELSAKNDALEARIAALEGS